MFWKDKKDNRRNSVSDMRGSSPLSSLHIKVSLWCPWYHARYLLYKTAEWSEVEWDVAALLSSTQLYSALQLTSQTALLAAGLGRTGSTRGLRVCPGWWLVLSLRSSLCSRGCPRDLAGPQPEKYHLRTVWRQTDRQHGTLTSDSSEESLNTNLSEGSKNRNRSKIKTTHNVLISKWTMGDMRAN